MSKTPLRIIARAGLAICKPIIGKDNYEFVRGKMDEEASEGKSKSQKPKR